MTTLAPTAQTIPDYVAGTWDIDPAHSEVSFLVRHMVVSKVRGRFNDFEGTIVTGEDPTASTVKATIAAGSIDTNQEQRDAHVRSADFLDVENHPTLSFTSTGLRPNSDHYVLEGDLTIRGVTKPVSLDLELNGFGPDLHGGTRVGFSASTEINRQDFGVSYNGPIPGANNAMVLSDKLVLNLEIEAVLRQAS
ncbi:MAG TPA: YceI family protein [Acidimicrobiales bacterium]|nr:YceI family protein [Acidimicrobiales bacterium]